MIGRIEKTGNVNFLSNTYEFDDNNIGNDVVIDSTGQNNGINRGGYKTAFGLNNYGIHLIEQNRVEIPDSPELRFEKKATIEGFINFYEINDTWIFLKRDLNNSSFDYQLNYINGNLEFKIQDENGKELTYENAVSFTEKEFHHIAVVVDRQVNHSIKIFVDGVEINGTPTGSFYGFKHTTTPFEFGNPSATSFSNNATYDNWRIVKGVALTEKQIKLRIQEIKNENPTTTEIKMLNLASSWEMENLSGDVIDGVNGLNGTISGTVTRGVPGITGNCFEFGGGEVRLPSNPLLLMNDGTKNKSMAFSFWCNFTTVGDAWFFNKRENTAGRNEYQLSYLSGALRLQIFYPDGSNSIFSIAQSFTAGIWEHICGFIDVKNGTMAIFRSGKLLGNPSFNFGEFATSTSDFVFGRAAWFDGLRFLGKMDSFRIWIGDDINKGLISHELKMKN